METGHARVARAERGYDPDRRIEEVEGGELRPAIKDKFACCVVGPIAPDFGLRTSHRV